MLYFTHLDRVSFHQWFPTSDGAGNFPHPSKPQPVVSTLLCAIGKAGFVSWQLPEAHASPSLRKCCWPLPWRIGISPITNTHKTDRAPCRTVFKVPILKDKTHFFFFSGKPKVLLSHSLRTRLLSLWCLTFLVLVPLPFHLTHRSLTEAHLHCQGRITPGQAFACHPLWWRGMHRNNLDFPKSLYPLWFFSCFAGLQAFTRAATDNAPENFFHLALFFSFFALCPSHHCLTSYCQSLHSILGDAEYSHFHFNHGLWGLEGNLEVTNLSSHRSSVLSSCNRQRLVFLWTLEVEGAALFCSAAHSITRAHLTSGIFLILNCHLSPGDIQPLLRLSVMLCRINLSPVRHAISSFVFLLVYLCLYSWNSVFFLICFFSFWWKQFSLQLLFAPQNWKQKAR